MRTPFLIAFLLICWGCGSSAKNVRISLPLPPKLDLGQYDYLYFPGFVADIPNEIFDTERETINYFRRELNREDVIGVLNAPTVDLSEKDPRTFFEKNQPFFKAMNFPRADQTLALTGVVSFETVDRSGFHEVERRDLSGRRVTQVQFVEVTGFNLDMRVYVYEMSSGRLLYRELLRDSASVEGSNPDHRLVFYDLLQRISNRVLGLFSNTIVKAERDLL